MRRLANLIRKQSAVLALNDVSAVVFGLLAIFVWFAHPAVMAFWRRGDAAHLQAEELMEAP
jgi:hypothetical protein